MRICYVTASILPSPYANSVNVMRMSAAFARAGHDVIVIGQKPGEQDALAGVDLLDHYGVPDELAGRLDVQALPVPSAGPARGLAYAPQVRRRVQALAPDLLYARHLLALMTTPRASAPRLYELHALPTAPAQRALLRALPKTGDLRGVIAISSALKRDFEAEYGHAAPVTVAHDACDPYDAVAASEAAEHVPLGGREGALQVGYVGSLYPGKGAELVCLLPERLPHVDVHVVGGDESERARLRAAAPHSNLHLHPRLPPRLVPGVYAQLDVALLPIQPRVAVHGGRGDIARWTSPLKLFEYLGAGLAVIASDMTVLKEVLVDGENCLMVPANDVGAWAGAVEHLHDPTLRNRLTYAGYLTASEHSWDGRASLVLSTLSPRP